MSLLSGKRILVTRPEQPDDRLRALLAAHGALVVFFPTIAIVPDAAQLARLEQVMLHLSDYDWLVFTSKNAVALFNACFEKTNTRREIAQRLRIAAIGPATEKALQESGFHVQFVPQEHVGEALARGMGEVRGQRVLLPHAQAAREALANILVQNGAIVDEVGLYHTVTSRPEPTAWQALDQGIDYVTFTSASTVHGFFELLGARAQAMLGQAVTACIGPVTAGALEEHGLKTQIVASQYSAEGLVQAVLDYSQKMKQEANR